jgi:hypothetical protein
VEAEVTELEDSVVEDADVTVELADERVDETLLEAAVPVYGNRTL